MKFFQGDRCNATLGGDRSIQLSYWSIYAHFTMHRADCQREIHFFDPERRIVDLSNILDSELIRQEPAEGSHGQVVGAAVMDGKLLGKVVE